MCLPPARRRLPHLIGLMILILPSSGWAQTPLPTPVAGAPLEWRAAPPTLTPALAGGWQVDVPGYALTDQPGQPRLPFAAALVAVPAGGTPTLEILELEQTWQPLPGPLADAAWPLVELPGPDGAPHPALPAARLSPAPISAVTLTVLGSLRGVTLARVLFWPVVPAGAGLRVTTHARVRVQFAAPAPTAAAPASADPLLAALAASVVNPAQVQAAPPQALPAQIQAAPGPEALIEVEAAGLTAISYAALRAAGFPVDSVDPATVRLERAGGEVALAWEAPNERFLFYAAPRFDRYTARDVYRLSVAAGPVPRLASRPAVAAGVTTAGAAWTEAWFETNAIYTASSCRCAPGWDGDRWMWEYLSRPGTDTRRFDFPLTAVEAAQPATLTVWLLGFTQGSHQVAVTVNGEQLGAALWSGQTLISTTVTVPAGRLAAGLNTLTLSVPNPDGVWLDAFQVRHARAASAAGAAATVTGAAGPLRYTVALTASAGLRVYDVTDPAQPVQLFAPLQAAGGAVTFTDPADNGQPRRYHVAAEPGVRVPAAVRAPVPLSGAAGADYLIISHPDFIPALGPLMALREAQGLRVAVEDVRAVYDAAGAGRPTPEALRAFLTTVYHTWSPRPAYIVLVGDGTYDPRRYRADSQPTFIPPYLADVDPYLGETAADNRLVAVYGADALPDFALGRLPVNSLAEAQTVVAKLVGYETAPPAGEWSRRALFVADDADAGGDFPADADAWAQALPAAWTTQRAYYSAGDAALAETRAALAGAWYSGVGVVVYNGHASPRQWGAEVFLHLDTPDVPHVAALWNGGRLPIVLEMTCLTGSFQDAARPALDEALLRAPAGGAVGVWGATGLGISAGHAVLATTFLTRLYQAEAPWVGPAAVAGKLQLILTAQSLDLVDTFLWLGDPATAVRLTVSPAYPVFLPVIRR